MFKFKEIQVESKENNLVDLDVKLENFKEPFDYFHMEDLTEAAQDFVKESGINNGVLTVQVMHTTCVLTMNELHEPMLMGDFNNHLREYVPKVKDYLHNSPLRTANRCEDDYKCDRNADAHLKAFLIGNATQSILVKDGHLLMGQWQRLGMVDFDGPRKRKVIFQVLGEE